MGNETWQDIKGYEGLYMVSSFGRVKSLSRVVSNHRGSYVRKDIILKLHDYQGYSKVVLQKEGKRKTIAVHILVCNAFIKNPENKPQVNHINFIRNDNRVENLEWCTALENVRHTINNGRKAKHSHTDNAKLSISRKLSKKIIDTSTGKVYKSTSEASEKTGIPRSTLNHYLLGTRKNKTSLRYL